MRFVLIAFVVTSGLLFCDSSRPKSASILSYSSELTRSRLYRRGLCTISPAPIQASPPQGFVAEQTAKFGEYVSDIWQRCKCGFRGLWDNWAEVRSIGKQKKNGVQPSLSDVLLIQRDRQDTGRLLRMIGIYAVVPSMLPYYLIFFPGALPSTFDLPKDKAHKLISLTNQRISGVLHALMELEKSCMNNKNPTEAVQANAAKVVTSDALCAKSWKSAVSLGASAIAYNSSSLGSPEKRKPDLSGIPDPFIKGMHIATGGGFSFLPGFLLKFQIRSHLEKVYELDQQVGASGAAALSTLSRGDLMDLCMDRCLGDPTWTAEQLVRGARSYYERLNELNSTLQLPGGFSLCPYRTRLALLSVNAVSSVRSVAVTGDLTRKLYAGSTTLQLGY